MFEIGTLFLIHDDYPPKARLPGHGPIQGWLMTCVLCKSCRLVLAWGSRLVGVVHGTGHAGGKAMRACWADGLCWSGARPVLTWCWAWFDGPVLAGLMG